MKEIGIEKEIKMLSTLYHEKIKGNLKYKLRSSLIVL